MERNLKIVTLAVKSERKLIFITLLHGYMLLADLNCISDGYLCVIAGDCTSYFCIKPRSSLLKVTKTFGHEMCVCGMYGRAEKSACLVYRCV